MLLLRHLNVRSPVYQLPNSLPPQLRRLRRGEFLLLIIGDGIQEGAANIVDFVQRYSGLHFNLALVEAALYRDGDNRLIVQPRVLAQTEIVQRFVVDGSVERVAVIDDADTQQETLSDQDEENLRFWTAVLRGYDFADVTAELPPPVKDSTLYVTVRHSGFAGWGLCFGGYIHRSASDLGCYLTARKDQARDVRIFDVTVQQLCLMSRGSNDDCRSDVPPG